MFIFMGESISCTIYTSDLLINIFRSLIFIASNLVFSLPTERKKFVAKLNEIICRFHQFERALPLQRKQKKKTNEKGKKR